MLDRTEGKVVRCAVYTRKSSEEGLEQDFNSLHAQREACESYILSQRHEGWVILPNAYDDGGYSGGSMERPGLRKLLADIAARAVDVVVVYKVDRLTRSLTDFAKIVEVFDASGASFVSVTQQFSTTSSMGRLTLNVLLSFAQFEREVTGERIRDKIAASKKKGLWMGGWVPIGYDRKDRTLLINEAEAETVKTIFGLYLKLGTVRLVEAELRRRNIRTKHYVATTGRSIGDRPFSRGHLYKILSCPLYAGDIVHKGVRHPGQHAAIVERSTWEAVQALLKSNGHEARNRWRARRTANLLAGLLFDEQGNKLIATQARRGSKQYRYYVAQHGPEPPPSDAPAVGTDETAGELKRSLSDRRRLRLPAAEIEPAVIREIGRLLTEPPRLIEALALSEAPPPVLSRVLGRSKQLVTDLEVDNRGDRGALLHEIVRKITIGEGSLCVELDSTALRARLAESLGGPGAAHWSKQKTEQPIRLRTGITTVRRGVETTLIIEGRDAATARPLDHALLKAIARGYCWFEDLVLGRVASMREIAEREGLSERFIAQQIDLCFLPPKLIEAVIAGEASPELSVKAFTKTERPLAWKNYPPFSARTA